MLATILKHTRQSLKEFENKLLDLKLKAFQPKVVFKMETDSYIIKTVETLEELRLVLALRYEVFHCERFGFKQAGLDFDRYDLMADHILLRHRDTGEAIGTYRLLSSEFTDEFYSQRQFDLGLFPTAKGPKLELGRACIRQAFRDGISLNLVWKGIGKYAKLTNAQYIFGCGSIRNSDPVRARALQSYLWQKALSTEFVVKPRWPYIFTNLPETADERLTSVISEHIPALLKSYIKAGAKVFSEPSYDAALKSTDFWMMLNLNNLSSKYQSRYF